MTHEEAVYELQLHAGVLNDAETGMILDDGFLPSLRPYQGRLRERNFHRVMEALLTVGERIHHEPMVDRELVAAVWSLCLYGRHWGLHPDGMLRRNKLIATPDVTRLERWVDIIEAVALDLLGGQPPHHVVYHYAAYVHEFGWSDDIDLFLSLMSRAVADPTVTDAIEMIVRALGKLGTRGHPALPALREALTRTYTWVTPVERCTQEVRRHIRQAIDSIEGA